MQNSIIQSWRLDNTWL